MLKHSNMPEGDEIPIRSIVIILGILLSLLVFTLTALAAMVMGTSVTALIGRALDGLFAFNTVQAMWYITRAAGLTAYLLMWLSTVWGLAVSTKVLEPALQGNFSYDFHEFISLLSIGFLVLHIVVLLADRYLPFSVAAVLVPFIAPYRPVWVGLGIIGFYLTLLVTVTFYLRRRIGSKTFRAIHLASFAAYVLSALHGLFAGTDSSLVTVRLMYVGTTLAVVFLTVYWLTMLILNRRTAAPTASRLAMPR
jgi:sulfoxide reductase heme-binding subunit YedZ